MMDLSARQADAWSFFNPTRIRFGAGCRQELVDMLAGKRVLIVTTVRGRSQIEEDVHLRGAIGGCAPHFIDTVQPNPDLLELQREIDLHRERHYDLVLAFGGGSALDAAKAIGLGISPGVFTSDLEMLIASPECLQNFGAIPLIAVPTTAGTGSEVTPFATVWDHKRHKKLSLANSSVAPHIAIVDPELTASMPYEVTASTGLDALNQAFESVWNRNANPVTLALAARAIENGLAALNAFINGGDGTNVRVGMAQASLLGGLCISQTRTALCHAISYPLTAHFDVPHGIACAFTMHAVGRCYLASGHGNLETVARLANLPNPEALLDKVGQLTEALRVRSYVKEKARSLDAIQALQAEMYTPGRSDNFPVALSSERLGNILASSYGAH